MKKFTFGLIALVGFGLTSCDLNSEQSVKNSVQVVNIVTDSENGTTTGSIGLYAYDINFTSKNGSVTAEQLTYDGSKHSVAFGTMTLQNGYMYGNGIATGQLSGGVANAGGSEIKDAKFNFAPDYAGLQTIIASYRIGNEYTVKTFPLGTYFVGSTHTTYPGAGGTTTSYENKDMFYVVVLNMEKMTANVTMMNAKFSDSNKEPVKNVLVENIPLEFVSGAYRITGADITPKLVEANSATEYPAFNIKNISVIPSSSDLVSANIMYTVEHTMTVGADDNKQEVTVTYTGQFTGAYTVLGSSIQ